MPEPSHENEVLVRKGRSFGQGAGELGASATDVVMVEQEVVEDGELVVCRAIAFA